MRIDTVTDFLAHTVSTWTLPGGVHVSGDDDQRRLSAFLKAHPLIEQALAARVAGAPYLPPAPMPSADAASTSSPASGASSLWTAAPSPVRAVAGSIQPIVLPVAAQFRQPDAGRDPAHWPKRPTRMSDARLAYSVHYNKSLKTQGDRTSDDKDTLLEHLVAFLNTHHPELGEDPWVHSIDSYHVSRFLTEQAERSGKRVDEDGNRLPAAPRTMLKKLSDLSHFFGYQCRTAKSTLENIAHDLADASEAWRVRAKQEDVHYAPFTDGHVQTIFSPATYLSQNRDPDYFWGPLLGLHLGVRLGDFVDCELKDIGYLAEIDTYYLDVPVDLAKNDNSVRRLPITQPLRDLGFIDYVERVRSLGARHLFPNRDWSRPTLVKDRSKNQSRKFADYLDKLGIVDPTLVFHSFRHTLVSAMQDAGVPLAHAMQIAGHEAQDHAIATGRITEAQARSVHLGVYTHADLERLGTKYPILPLKDALERSMQPPIDYRRLRNAADVVLEHVRKVGDSFRSGWPAQRERYTDEMVARV